MSADGGRPGLVARARELAAMVHRGQERKATGMPYIEHADTVARILSDSGFGDEVVAAGLLHDAVEHTSLSLADVREACGDRVAELVAAMTDRDDIEDWAERKDEHRTRVERAGRDACAIYGADKLSGITEARSGWASQGAAVEQRLGVPIDVRLGVWRDDLRLLDRQDPPLPFRDRVGEAIANLAEESATAPRSGPGAAAAGHTRARGT